MNLPPNWFRRTGIRRFQRAVECWYKSVFVGTPEEHSKETLAMRFLEEAVELAQAMGLPEKKALVQVAYTYGRPPGTPEEEIAGSMMTLMHCGYICGVDVQDAATKELARIDTPEMRRKIYEKQAYKNSHGLSA